MRTIHTLQGPITVRQPTPGILRAIRSLLPYGAFRFPHPYRGADYGIVMKCGERELQAVVQLAPDSGEQDCLANMEADSTLIAHALPRYLAHGFTGIMMPAPFMRPMGRGRYESGIAYFAFPSPSGIESREQGRQESFDPRFGHGFTTMMTAFTGALHGSSRETEIGMSQVIGVEERAWSRLGMVDCAFLVVGSRVVWLKSELPAEDPLWMTLRAAGVTEMFHMGSFQSAVAGDDLAVTKPADDIDHLTAEAPCRHGESWTPPFPPR
jgi:hypothetical protein